MGRKYQERSKKLILWGRKYNSLNEIAVAFGLNVGSLFARMDSLDDLELVVSELLNKEKICFKGNEYSGLTELAVAYGQEASLVFDRLYNGYEMERALTQPIRKLNRPEFEVEYHGKKYSSKRQLFREIGFSSRYIADLMKSQGIELERAVDIACETKRRAGIPMEKMLAYIPVGIIRGKIYNKAVELINEVGMTSSVIQMYKSRHGYTGILETLQAMQKETVECYSINGERKNYYQLLALGYTSVSYRKVPKELFPAYPQLVGIDLETDCVDVMKIYNEVKEEFIPMKNEMQMNM